MHIISLFRIPVDLNLVGWLLCRWPTPNMFSNPPLSYPHSLFLDIFLPVTFHLSLMPSFILQDHLETVIPAIGCTVLIVNGKCRGSKAELLSLDIDNFCASIKVRVAESES